MPTVTVPLSQPYDVEIERGGLARAGALVARFARANSPVALISSPRIHRHWGAAAEQSLRGAGLHVLSLELRDGERHKTLAGAGALAEAMAAEGADRDSVVVALGGGVVGDVAGFVAASFMRGVAVVQLPTTLVAMIDSAIGGKTGVNLRAGKNLFGAFHQPRAVLADPEVLRTLPQREYRSGLAEALKYGVIADRELFEFTAGCAGELRRRETAPLERLIAACVRIKAEVVAEDERERDRRRILNFGHTLGHALERAGNYRRYLHGEAVAWGMIAATRLAAGVGRLEAAEAARIEAAVLALTAPLPPIEEEPRAILAHVARDKKTRGGVPHFVLPRAIGAVEIVPGVPEPAVAAALEATIALSRAA